MHRRSRERHLVVAVVVSFGFMMVAFVTSRTITEIQSRKIQRDAESIGNNALIATEALAATRANVGRLIFEMNALRVRDRPDVVEEHVSEIDTCRREMLAQWARYISIPFYPGERELVRSVEPSISGVELATRDLTERLRSGDRESGLRFIDTSVMPAIERANEGLERLLGLNRREARSAAVRILASKRPWGLLPEFLGALFAIVAALFGIRLLAQYLRWAAERSAELEGFAGRVAHDIRSPLGSASLALQIAQQGNDVDSKTRTLLARARRTLEHIAKLVDGLLVFATSGGYLVPGMLGVEEKASTADIISGVVEDARLEAAAQHIELDYQAPEPDLVVACSPGVLISMTTNLVSNAMKFMGDARVRRIAITVRRLGTAVEIAVSDTGPGIAPELRKKAFAPYVRGDSKVPGFGLGLATVQKLAEAHGGAVGVENNSGGGCRFWFRIPAWKEPRTRQVRQPHPAQQTI